MSVSRVGVFSFFNDPPQNMNSLLIFYVENRNKNKRLGSSRGKKCKQKADMLSNFNG